MADISGIVSEDELEALKAAGYEVEVAGALEGEETLYSVNVWVTCDVIALLSPPMCQYCVAMMDHDYTPDQEGGTDLFVCPDCGRQVRIVVDRE